MDVNVLFDLANKQITPTILPGTNYNVPVLIIQTKIGTLSLETNNDQLAEIGEAIQQHLQKVRYHETPDQQQILNQEYENHTEVAV